MCAAPESAGERDAVDARSAVVVPVGEVVVQVDVEVRRPAPPVEIEHAAASTGAGVELDAAGLGGERERVPGRQDVDPLVRPLWAGRAEVVDEGDGSEHGKDDLLSLR